VQFIDECVPVTLVPRIDRLDVHGRH
jgi:hypothetical protein